jgi:hypothetical protein
VADEAAVELPADGVAAVVPVLEVPVRGCEVVDVEPDDVCVPAAGEVVLVVGCEEGVGLVLLGLVLLGLVLLGLVVGEGAGCALAGWDWVGAGAAAGWLC